MQLMTWTIARLGSRFALTFEPYRRRVLHSATGRFCDAPLDLMAGMVEPDGTTRVLPFTRRVTHGGDIADFELRPDPPTGEGVVRDLLNPEQFERVNSITYRGHSETHHLRFELNLHSVFYPQDDKLCVMPAFYLEMRVHPMRRVRWFGKASRHPRTVKLVLRLARPDTRITSEGKPEGGCSIRLAYDAPLRPASQDLPDAIHPRYPQRTVPVEERIVSLNPGCIATPEGDGLTYEIPVTEPASGTKWRLVWGTFVGDPVMRVGHSGNDDEDVRNGRFRYTRYWSSLDEVLDDAVATRDDRLAHSRRFEKVLDQAPLDQAQAHLLNQSFQAYLSNTFWCDLDGVEEDDVDAATRSKADDPREWFSVWEGSCFFNSTIDVEYNISPLYLAIWPHLLRQQLRQWARYAHDHEASGGKFLSHDTGVAAEPLGQGYGHDMQVEENSNYLLMLQAYCRWTGHTDLAYDLASLVRSLADYLKWTDRDGSGFPSEGVANTVDDASAAIQYSRKQTYLAVKRVAALRAAGDVLTIAGKREAADVFLDTADRDAEQIADAAWLGDHYAVCVDPSAEGIVDVNTGKPVPFTRLTGWDAYSIYTGNGLLLPYMVGQPLMLPTARLKADLLHANRETLSRYGCGHTSAEPDNVWVSQNLWRDMLARYLGLHGPSHAARYWDMQVMSNTHQQSYGFIDTYINNALCFYPRGITSITWLLATPRLVIDRLAPGGTYITVDPDRDQPSRWPLLPLADWKAGKVPVCVVDTAGRATIEGGHDPIIIHGQPADAEADADTGVGLIG